MNSNIFFKKKNINIKNIFPKIKLKKNFLINQVRPLSFAKSNDLTFFDHIKYKDSAADTTAGACITTEKLKKFLPQNIEIIIVKNVLFELAKILKIIYSSAEIDYPDLNLRPASKKIS